MLTYHRNSGWRFHEKTNHGYLPVTLHHRLEDLFPMMDFTPEQSIFTIRPIFNFHEKTREFEKYIAETIDDANMMIKTIFQTKTVRVHEILEFLEKCKC